MLIKPGIKQGEFNSIIEKNIYTKLRKKLGGDIPIEINQKIGDGEFDVDGDVDMKRRRKPTNSKCVQRRYELDLFFPAYKIGVEIQGPRHTASIDAIMKDYVKLNFCKRRGISIIYIYTNNTTQINSGIECVVKTIQVLTKKVQE